MGRPAGWSRAQPGSGRAVGDFARGEVVEQTEIDHAERLDDAGIEMTAGLRVDLAERALARPGAHVAASYTGF